ncbi:uncharacterized protein V1516DRAFT_681333 [Lipomyces oligophaga]|uniref:uncharacterized protein n=1 Tax=Lipomyces oligophaga TaxID=45792 RepID=UPI0034CE4365
MAFYHRRSTLILALLTAFALAVLLSSNMKLARAFQSYYHDNNTPLDPMSEISWDDISFSSTLASPTSTGESSGLVPSSTAESLHEYIDNSFVPPDNESNKIDTLANYDKDTMESLPSPNCCVRSRRVHLLFPATEINQLVCKTMFSAFLNNYPDPILLNFNSKFKSPTEAHFMKISAIYNYLDKHTADNDLVIIMDSYDTWFQLSFETLISRYYQLQANDLLVYYSDDSTFPSNISISHDIEYVGQNKSSVQILENVYFPELMETSDSPRVNCEYGSCSRVLSDGLNIKTDDIPGFKEQVVFGADKGCWPNKKTSKACTNVPESSLDPTIYGAGTDIHSFRMRPRWLNSGNMMGPASVLREIYKRAFAIQKRAKSHFSDQLIIADIFGERDLPIRIDYESFLFQTMTFSHSDIVFLYSEEVDLENPESRAISDLLDYPVLDEKLVPKPFRDSELINSAFLTNASNRMRFSDKYLAWNRVSGHAPAVLHFNGRKEPLETWWNKFWWMKDSTPDARNSRLNTVQTTKGAYGHPDHTNYMTFGQMCNKFNMYESKLSRFDKVKNIKPGAGPTFDPEPFRLGMDKYKSPADILIALQKMKEQKAKEEKLKKEKKLKEEQAGRQEQSIHKSSQKSKTSNTV